MDGERGKHRLPGMVLAGDGSAEQGHEPVAEELVDRSLVAVHLLERDAEEAVEEIVEALGPQALRERGRMHDVAEEHAHLLALALHGAR